jgi:hypothetical protein
MITQLARSANNMAGDDVLDSATHEKYLDIIVDRLTTITDELSGLRADIQRLPTAIAKEIGER